MVSRRGGYGWRPEQRATHLRKKKTDVTCVDIAMCTMSRRLLQDIMGLVYNIMVKFLRFDDDDDGGDAAGNAADALLRWCKFQTKGYKGVNVTNLKKSWADGLALCALVHKFAPDAIPFDKLSSSNSQKNIGVAMDAAEKCFLVEKFLTPREVAMLDDKGMLVRTCKPD